MIESANEFYSGRLTKKERKATLADELLSDHKLRDYRSDETIITLSIEQILFWVIATMTNIG